MNNWLIQFVDGHTEEVEAYMFSDACIIAAYKRLLREGPMLLFFARTVDHKKCVKTGSRIIKEG